MVLEAKIDKGKGPVATILVTSGELKKGNYFVCGNTFGKIRAMIDFNGKNIPNFLISDNVENWDSVGHISLIAEIEKEFHIKLNEEYSYTLLDEKKILEKIMEIKNL